MDAVRLEGICRYFGGVRAIDGVDLAVAEGSLHAVIGPNGAGKTTLFHLIGGQLRPTRGRVLLRGEDVTSLPAHRRAARGLARTFQINSLFPGLSVEENVLLAVQAAESVRFLPFRPALTWRRMVGRVHDLLEESGLDGKRGARIAELSYGQQRQLEVLLALAGEPRVLLLDEPAAGLAPAEVGALVERLQGLRGRISVLLVEHDVETVFQVADRVTVLDRGRVMLAGPPDEVRGDPRVLDLYLGEE